MVRKAKKATKSPRKGIKSASKEENRDSVGYSKPLANPRHERFCQEYHISLNSTAAYKIAYPKSSQKGAETSGPRLLGNVRVMGRLLYLQAKLGIATGVDAKMVIEGFRKIATGTVGKHLSNRNKRRALENLAKHLGLYSKDNEQRVGLTLADIAALAGVKRDSD